MANRNFRELIEAKWAEGKFVCVGLDSEYEKIPSDVLEAKLQQRIRTIFSVVPATVFRRILAFNSAIIDATADIVCAYKPNVAFYEACGDVGWLALRETIVHIRAVAPEVPVVLDAKRADIGNTNSGYIKNVFDFLGVDAVTVNPYLGAEALTSFLDCKDKGIIVLCRTSNPGAGEFQDLHTLTLNPRAKPLGMTAEEWLKILCYDAMQLYERVAFNVATKWNRNGNCLLVVAATYPTEVERIRVKVGDVPFLIPGIGAQGGDVEATVMASHDGRGWGMIINSSRGIIFYSKGSNFAEAARHETLKLHETITDCLRKGVSQ